jgi:hypothetical protein
VPAGGTTGGTLVIDGWAMDGWTIVGWVIGPGRAGPEPDPDGGAKLSAGPDGTSGTEAGGIGGGRSPNSWADAGAGISRKAASANSGRSHPPRPHLPMPLPLEIMAHAFQRKRGEFKPS